jgi:hypothetical protein
MANSYPPGNTRPTGAAEPLRGSGHKRRNTPHSGRFATCRTCRGTGKVHGVRRKPAASWARIAATAGQMGDFVAGGCPARPDPTTNVCLSTVAKWGRCVARLACAKQPLPGQARRPTYCVVHGRLSSHGSRVFPPPGPGRRLLRVTREEDGATATRCRRRESRSTGPRKARAAGRTLCPGSAQAGP